METHAMDASLAMIGGGEWDEDDHEMMQFLLLGDNPSDVDDNVSLTQMQTLAHTQSKTETKTSTTTTPGQQRGSKAKLTAVERRAKHREVVRRSYHRHKAVLSDLKDTVQKLEAKMYALQVERASDNQQLHSHSHAQTQSHATVPGATTALKQQVDDLTAQSAALQSEAAALQQTLASYQRFVATVYAASTSSDDDDSSSDNDTDDTSGSCFQQQQQQQSVGSPWRELVQPETSDEDMSPTKRTRMGKFYHSPRPAYVSNPTPCAPLATCVWQEIGFAPLTLAQARAFVGETYERILTFALSGRAVSTGARVMGWEDKRVIDGTAMKFSLRKQFAGETANRLMTETWMCFSDPECADKKFRGLMTLRILQHVNEDTIVALRDATSPDGATVFRCVYLLFRVRTRSGFIICSRSIDHIVCNKDVAAQTTPDGRAVQWVQLNGWFIFDQLGYADATSAQFHETGAQVEYGGSVDYGDASQLPRLAMDTLSVVSRWEGFMVQPVFLLPPAL